ncbi:MAG: amidohydrolase family protein [Kofleriaceae bacterium]
MRRSFAVLSLVFAVGILAPAGCSCGSNNNDRPDSGTDAPPDGMQTTEVVCETLPPIASGATCEVTGTGTAKLLKGIVLTPTTVYRGGQVAVDAAGAISCVGCDCAAGGETVISCPDGTISPGLINTHDHITFTQNQPYTQTAERYEHRHQWRRGQDMHHEIPSAGGASADQIRWGELRFLMGGATSIVGSGGQPGLLRNLDSANQEGLSQGRVNFDTFPLDDSGGNRRTTDCNYGADATTAESIAGDAAYEPHTAEGIDTTARNEFLCESSDAYDTAAPGISHNLLLGKTAMIHAIGLQPSDYGAMANAGTGLIWSPRSNITLYGDTAKVTTAERLGVEIALGTDWMPTGSMNLLRELKCADSLNKSYYHYFTDVQLWQMVTTNAAAVTATDDVIGLLAAGKVADIAVFKANGGKTFRAVIDAEPQDVALVMRGGKTLYGDDTTVAALAQNCDVVDVCTTSKRVCTMGEVGKTYDALKTAAGANIYPAFACGEPENEPSCKPARTVAVNGSTVYTGDVSATDSDGDGIADASDKCPMVFDPIRPVDNGVQGDSDNDGVGDACDPCPLDPDTSTCTVVDPNDRDHDGVANDVDNCPDIANTDQADGDSDDKGDVCDACPTVPNPGAAGCAVSIYSIKDGTTPTGTTVRVNNAIVTGRGTNGFFVQIKEGDTGYLGSDNSGLFVFTGAAAPTLANATVGARVTIDGRIAVFQSQIELDTVTSVTVNAVGPEAAPAPIAATYAEVKTGGTRATKLESVIVSLGASNVTAADAAFGEFTMTAGTDTLIGDDFLFVPVPPVAVGQAFTAVKGILTLRQMASKLEPRNAADLTAGAPGLLSITPALSFARVGVTTAAPTFPTPLTVTLTGPAQGNTVVTIVSGDDTKLTVANVTIPDGATSAAVPVTAVAANATPVNVTAQLGVQLLTAQVRVLGAAEAPTTVVLTPPDATVAIAGTVLFTVTLDTPALVATQVALAVTPAGSGTLPANVTVTAGQTTATFTYTNTATSGDATVTATFNGNTSTATVTVSTGANHLVINEVDYDQAMNPDNAEFIEIFNPSAAAISLAGIQVLLVNGNGNTVYATIDLATVNGGSLPANGYIVIAGANVSVPATPGVFKLDPGFTTDEIQNGAPDGIALVNNTTHVLIDALSYEGSMIAVDLPGFPPGSSLVEGTATTASDVAPFTQSICRSPNGQDTDNAVVDWKVCAVPSPGTVNP